MGHLKGFQDIHYNLANFNRSNFHQGFAGYAIAYNQLVPRLAAHDLGDMAGVFAPNAHLIRAKLLGCYKITLHIQPHSVRLFSVKTAAFLLFRSPAAAPYAHVNPLKITHYIIQRLPVCEQSLLQCSISEQLEEQIDKVSSNLL
ncbi:hypothetical protein D3C74_349780 [compost metagenome]